MAAAICLLCNAMAAYAIIQVFPVMLAALKAHGFLYLLASIEVAAVLAVLLFLPETKVGVCVCVCVLGGCTIYNR